MIRLYTVLFGILIFCFSAYSAVSLTSITTYDTTNTSDNDNIYHTGQQISIEVWTTNDTIGQATVEIVGPGVYWIHKTPMTTVINGQGPSNNCMYQYLWNTSSPSTPEGNYTIYIYYDLNGSSNSSETALIDNTNPSITGDTAAGSVHASAPFGNETITFTINLSDTGGASVDTSVSPTVKFDYSSVTQDSFNASTWVGHIATAGKNGTLTLEVTDLYDTAGNTNSVYTSTYTVDTTSPTVSNITSSPIQPPAFGKGQSVTFTVVYDDGTGVGIDTSVSPTVTYNSSTVTQSSYSGNTWQGTITMADGWDGNYNLSVSGAQDLTGNTQVASTEAFDVDTVLPTISSVATTPASAPFPLGYVTFEITFDDTMDTGTSPTVTFDGNSVSGIWSSNTKWTGSIEITTGWSAGTKTLSVSGAKDDGANTMATDTSNTYSVDPTKPTLQTVTPVSGTTLASGSHNFTIVFSETMDNGTTPNVILYSGTTVETVSQTSFSGNTWQGSVNITTNDGQGTYTLEVGQAKDTAGNIMATDETNIYPVDTVPPTLYGARTTDADNIYKNSDNINVEVTGEASLNTVEVDLSTIDSSLSWVTMSEAPAGTYTSISTLTNCNADNTYEVTARAYDSAGNTAEATFEVIIDNTAPTPEIVTTPANDPFSIGMVTFEVNFTDKMDTSAVTVSLSTHTINGDWVTKYQWVGTVEIDDSWTTETTNFSFGGAKDISGNPTSPDPYTKSYDIDVTRPTLQTVTPTSPDWFGTESVTFNLTFSRDMTTEVSHTPEVWLIAQDNDKKLVNGNITAGNKKLWTGSISIDGTFSNDDRLTLEVSGGFDTVGNEMNTDETNIYYVDFASPEVDIFTVTDKYPVYTNTSTINFQATAELGLMTVEVDASTLDNQTTFPLVLTETPMTGTSSVYLGNFVVASNNTQIDGTKEIALTAYDTAENTTVKTKEIWLDNTKPILESVNIPQASENKYLATGEVTIEVVLYDSSEIWGFGMDLTDTPEIDFGGTHAVAFNYTTIEINGGIRAIYTGEILVTDIMAGNQLLTVKNAKDIAGNVMIDDSTYSYEVITDRPTVDSYKVYQNGRDVSETNVIGFGDITMEIVFSQSMKFPSYTPEIHILQESTDEVFSTTEGSFDTTSVKSDTYRSGIVNFSQLLQDGALTIEVSGSRNMSDSLLITKEITDFTMDVTRPTLETAIYDDSNNILRLGFSESITTETTSAANIYKIIELLDTNSVNILDSNVDSFQVSGSTFEIKLSTALTDGTFEVVVYSSEVGIVDLGYNKVDTSEIGYTAEIDYMAPVIAAGTFKIYDDTSEIDSINHFLKYHPDDLGHSNADSIEICFGIEEYDELDTTSVSIHWEDEFGGGSSSSTPSYYSFSNGTYYFTFEVDLSSGTPNIGRPGTVKLWLSAWDKTGNVLPNGSSNSDPAATAEVRWMQPANTVEAEINSRLVKPSLTDQLMTVSIHPEFQYYDSGIERVIVSNLPSAPTNPAVRYYDGSWHTISSVSTSTTSSSITLTLQGGIPSGNLDILDNIDTLEVSFRVNTKSTEDAPDGTTIEVKVANVTTSSYPYTYPQPSQTNTSAEITSVPGETDGIDNIGEPSYIHSKLNVHTRNVASSIVAEIVPYLGKPDATSAEITLYAYPTIDFPNTDAGINKVVFNLDGLHILKTEEVKVGGIAWTGLESTFEVSSFESTVELTFPNGSYLQNSKTIEVKLLVNIGPEDTNGKTQKVYADFVYPGMSYPLIAMAGSAGNADSTLGDSETLNFTITYAAAGGTFTSSPQYFVPDITQSKITEVTSTVTPVISAGATPGIDYIQLYYTPGDSFEIHSIKSIKINGATASYTYNPNILPPLGKSIEVTLSSPVKTNSTPIAITYNLVATKSSVTGEVICKIGNTSDPSTLIDTDTVEVKSGYPATQSSGTTLEVMRDGVVINTHNIPVSSTVDLEYLTTFEIGALNTGISKFYIIVPTGFSNSSVSTVEINSVSKSFTSSLQNQTLEITLNDLISSEVTTIYTAEVFFSGTTSSTPNSTLKFNILLDNNVASYPIQCQPSNNELYTKRLISSSTMTVSPSFVAPISPQLHHYTAEITTSIQQPDDSGIDQILISLANHSNLTIEALAIDGNITTAVIIDSKEITLNNPVTSSSVISVGFKGEPSSSLDYPTGSELKVWLDNTSIVVPTEVTSITSGGTKTIAITDVANTGTFEVNCTSSFDDGSMTVGSREIVLVGFKPDIPTEYKGIKKVFIGFDANATVEASTLNNATFKVGSHTLTTITSGTPDPGEALFKINGYTVEITLGSEYGNSYDGTLFVAGIPMTPNTEQFYQFTVEVTNLNITGVSTLQLPNFGDVDSAYSNNSRKLYAYRALVESGSAISEISPTSSLVGETQNYTYKVGFNAYPLATYSGIDTMEIVVPSEFTLNSVSGVVIKKNGVVDGTYGQSSPISGNKILVHTTSAMTGAYFTVEVTFNATAQQTKTDYVDFNCVMKNTLSTGEVNTVVGDVDGDSSSNMGVKIAANFTSALAEITPSVVSPSTEVTFDMAILPSFDQNDNGINKISIIRPSTYTFNGNSSEVVQYVGLGNSQYTYTSNTPDSGEYSVSYTNGDSTIEISLGDTIETNQAVRVTFNVNTPANKDAPTGTEFNAMLDNTNTSSPIAATAGDASNSINTNALKVICNSTQIVDVYNTLQASYTKKWKVLFKINFSSEMDVTQQPTVTFAPYKGTTRSPRYTITQISYYGKQFVGIGEFKYSDTNFDSSIEVKVENAVDVYGNKQDALTKITNLNPGFAIGYFFSPLVSDQLNIITMSSEALKNGDAPEILVKQKNNSSTQVSMNSLTGGYYKGLYNVQTDPYYMGDGTITGNGVDTEGYTGETVVNFTVSSSSTSGGSVSAPDNMASLSYPQGAMENGNTLYMLSGDEFPVAASSSAGPLRSSQLEELDELSPVYIVNKGIELKKNATFKLKAKTPEKSGIFYLDNAGRWTLADTSYTNEVVSASIPYLSSIAFFKDEKAPKLVCRQQIKEFRIGESRLVFDLSDNGAGIDADSIKMMADSHKLKPFYVPELQQLVLDSDGIDLQTGNYNLNLEVQDKLGNKSSLKMPIKFISGFTMKSSVAPNPADYSAYIYYTLGCNVDEINIRIYDSSGRRIKNIYGASTTAGSNSVEWDLTNRRSRKVANGVYFIRIEAKLNGGKIRQTLKLAVLQ